MNGQVTVGNRRVGDKGVYVGRPSVLGNPWVEGIHGTRREVIERFIETLFDDLMQHGPMYAELARLARLVKRGQDVRLVCWCSPQECHADALKAILEELAGSKPPQDNDDDLDILEEMRAQNDYGEDLPWDDC